jgi:hypothetical protein
LPRPAYYGAEVRSGGSGRSSLFNGTLSTGKAAIKGCLGSVAIIGATAGTAMMVTGWATGGASLLPSGAAFATGCLGGAAGGAFTHVVTGGKAEEYDTSSIYDSYALYRR